MRQDLVRLLGELPTDEPYDEQLKNLMRVLFGSRIEEKSILLRNVSLGVAVDNLPQGEVEGKTLQSISREDKASVLSRVPRRRSSLPLFALGAIAVVGVGAAVFVATRPPPLTPAPTSAPVSATIAVSLDSTPTGATVRIDGNDVGTTPYALTLPRGTKSVLVEVSKDGFAAQEETIVPSTDQRIHVALAATTPGTPVVPVRRSRATKMSTKPSAGHPSEATAPKSR